MRGQATQPPLPDGLAIRRGHPDRTGNTSPLHRTLIPFATADEAEQLAEAPDTEPEQIYAILTAAGHKLTWHETVSARMPLPDERSTLDIPDATPILHTARVTHGTDDRPLILEELRASADRAQLAFKIASADSTQVSSA
ncbi:transcriptional regulator, GntR family [Streptomyces iranensis]|uniref:DNA-binding GntR family transcriptional regulator n=1 Tax=Streptomyces iranensis TaxID=576784 RepID=A0A060ZM22_9ACTN|nr:DNA-binding GntR family transcriptional regulator [Streptomyces iranensis]CDR07207.1 transcriptional regulator, GntR family [Streptomyces iranensis]